ncbi:hypothetical protein DXG01_014270 [Tephrocybe rancida]|nr:hypothetical protein DXG01_014270 [Tephrocybe rancida]
MTLEEKSEYYKNQAACRAELAWMREIIQNPASTPEEIEAAQVVCHRPKKKKCKHTGEEVNATRVAVSALHDLANISEPPPHISAAGVYLSQDIFGISAVELVPPMEAQQIICLNDDINTLVETISGWLKNAEAKFAGMAAAMSSEFYMIDSISRSWIHSFRLEHTKLLDQFVSDISPDTRPDGLTKISAKETKVLKSGEWINDSVLEYLTTDPAPPPGIIVLSPLFYTKFLLQYSIVDTDWDTAWRWKNNQACPWLYISQDHPYAYSLEEHYKADIKHHNWMASMHADLIQASNIKESFQAESQLLQGLDLQSFKMYPHVKMLTTSFVNVV